MENHSNIEVNMMREAGIDPTLDVVDQRARLVARTWHRCPEFAATLLYRGISLGVPLEQVLVHDLIPVFADAEQRNSA